MKIWGTSPEKQRELNQLLQEWYFKIHDYSLSISSRDNLTLTQIFLEDKCCAYLHGGSCLTKIVLSEKQFVFDIVPLPLAFIRRLGLFILFIDTSVSDADHLSSICA